MEINKEDVEFWKNTLRNYYYLKEKESYYRRLVLEMEMKIDEEREVSGISYDDINGNGCSVSYPKESYINQLISELSGYEREAEKHQVMHNSLNRTHRIQERILSIPYNQQVILYAVFRKHMTYKMVSIELFDGELSKQAVNERVDDAIRSLIAR